MNNNTNDFHQRAMEYAEKAELAKFDKNFTESKDLLKKAFDLEYKAAKSVPVGNSFEPTRSILYRSATSLAMEIENFSEALKILKEGLTKYTPDYLLKEFKNIEIKLSTNVNKMNIKILQPEEALNTAYRKKKSTQNEIEKFKTNFINIFEQYNENESEEFHKNLISDFLKNTYYSPNYFINTKGRNDLVIHNGNNAKSSVGIIIETKKQANKAEMISKDNINKKAFQELILYFLRERLKLKNFEIKHLIVTNIHEWFIFDSSYFEKNFAQNKNLKEKFLDFEEGRLSVKTTDVFYKDILSPIIQNLQDVTFTYFDVREFENFNNKEENDKDLILLFKIFSPEHLLKLPFTNDSNYLNKSFYTELLYIMGLGEIKKGNQKLITRQTESERNAGSLLENTINHIKTLNKLSKINKLSNYGKSEEEQLFNISLDLNITWINRILFLKLLEAQLVNYHNEKNIYAFLNKEKVKSYTELESLFFSVLACKPQERNEDVKRSFEKIPYLNSSLFEVSELEYNTLISNLNSNKTMPIFLSTVLKDRKGKKRQGEINTLEYLFEFLDAYDFSSESSEEIQEESKALINASVLGLIFEKINGYKDGSFFTPGFITTYMCYEVITRIILEKFKENRGWDCKNLNQLYNKIDDRKEANKIINSIKICDPAVGSGHFLVSSLNQIIAIKSELKILEDRNGNRLKEYKVEVFNDDLIITDENGSLFEYNPKNSESQRIQEALFHEKQTIIENCLFGVDINPNSVKICRLRLWIELLKNAYYKKNNELETLPNIDINIKCGNSLISRYDLDSDLVQILKNNKINISEYKAEIHSYHNVKNKNEKQNLEKIINSKKNIFQTEINRSEEERLTKLKYELDVFRRQKILFEETEEEKLVRKQKQKKIENAINNLTTKIEEVKNNKIYENAFEWRFEFPEVLDENGNFLGFDIIIGNPPYIPLELFSKNERNLFKQKFLYFERKFETSVLFIVQGFNILKQNGLLSYIAPSTWQTGENYSKFRKYIITERGISKIINLPFNIFEDAYIDTSIYLLNKSKNCSTYEIFNFNKKDKNCDLSKLNFSKISINSILSPDYKLILDSKAGELLERFNNLKFISLGKITKSTQGLSKSKFPKTEIANLNDNIYPLLAKGNVYNYQLVKKEIYLTDMTNKSSLKQFYENEPKLLIRRVVNRKNRLDVGFCNEKIVFKKDINPFICIDKRFNTFFLLGIMASKFISYLYLRISSIATKDDFRQTTLTELRKIPIPIVSQDIQVEISNYVEKILELKKQDQNLNTANLEEKIDQLIYIIYELNKEEIDIVEQNFKTNKIK